jgi:5'-nucleotidase / UDP-sugar diphosphatase
VSGPVSRSAASLALACLASSCLIQTEQPVLDGQDVRLTILHTSDIHSRLLPYDLAPLASDVSLGLSPLAAPFGGAARLAALIERERGRSQRVLYYDSGDCFQGAPIFNENHGAAEIQWLSLMRADAVVVGNHEFDEGAPNLFDQVSRHGSYPLLAANYDFRDPRNPSVAPLAHVVSPYVIRNVQGLKVGIIGMANISSLNSIVAEGNSVHAMPLEQNEILRAYVELLLPQVDVVSVVSHLGLTEDGHLVQGYQRTFYKHEVTRFTQRRRDPWVMVHDLSPGDPEGRAIFRIPGVRGLDFIMGGHLHVVLNPPQVLTDPDGRSVVLAHSGAFSKYLGRLDLILHQDPDFPEYGWTVKTHSYRAFPVDAAWCVENRPPYQNTDAYRAWVQSAVAECAHREHAPTRRLLDPYLVGLNQSLDLPRIFAWAPATVQRRNQTSGGDAPLGNLTADAMRRRRGVEAELAVTNTLGIRDALYAGPINLESMFNVFPFENAITVMYLSGAEIQELLDFVTSRSAGRGCQSQAQVAGVSFVMDCGQVQANGHRYTCELPADCPNFDAEGIAGIPWECRSGTCFAHPARDILVNGEPLERGWSYRVATNDYIARGGSGFRVLARNTTQFDTGISIRDALIESMRNFCNCEQVLAAAPMALEGDDVFLCRGEPLDLRTVRACEAIRDDPGAAHAGRCTCREVNLAREHGRDDGPCGHVGHAMAAFCEDPMRVPIVLGYEDGRIVRRVVDRSLEGR